MTERMQNLEETILAYLSGSLDDAGRERLENWIAQSKENEQQFQEIKKLLQASKLDISAFNPDIDRAWAKVESQIDLPSSVDYSWVYRLAAAVVLAIGLGVFGYNYWESDLEQVATLDGEVLEYVLPDGTRILLNENTTIAFDQDFDDDSREVSLEGQAYFHVSRDESRPFVIKGLQTNVEVLGTSFDYASIPSGEEVNVTSGKVAFYKRSEERIKANLTKGDRGVLKADGVLAKSSQLNSDQMEWRDVNMTFKSAPLSEVINILAKFYQVSFKLKGNIGSCLITSSFEGQDLEQALKTLEIIAGVKNKKKGNVVNLTGPGC